MQLNKCVLFNREYMKEAYIKADIRRPKGSVITPPVLHSLQRLVITSNLSTHQLRQTFTTHACFYLEYVHVL